MSDFISVNLKKLKDNKIPNPEIDLRILLNYSRCCESEIILSNFKTEQIDIKKFNLLQPLHLDFFHVNKDIFPLYFYFKSIDKTNPSNLIKFNTANEYAVDLFKQKKINFLAKNNIPSYISDIQKVLEQYVSEPFEKFRSLSER